MAHPGVLANYKRCLQKIAEVETNINELQQLVEHQLSDANDIRLKTLYSKRKDLKTLLTAIEKHLAGPIVTKPIMQRHIALKLIAVSGTLKFKTDEVHGFVGRNAKSNFMLYDRTKRCNGVYYHSVTPGGGLVYASGEGSIFPRDLALTFSQYHKRSALREGAVSCAPVKAVTKASKKGSFYFGSSRPFSAKILEYYYVVLEKQKNGLYSGTLMPEFPAYLIKRDPFFKEGMLCDIQPSRVLQVLCAKIIRKKTDAKIPRELAALSQYLHPEYATEEITICEVNDSSKGS